MLSLEKYPFSVLLDLGYTLHSNWCPDFCSFDNYSKLHFIKSMVLGVQIRFYIRLREGARVRNCAGSRVKVKNLVGMRD